MAQPTDSFKQFDYALRPSKQVERKVMIEILLNLFRAGYNISDYHYVGFGSPYYVDFVMFHKYLFINDMLCVEWANVEKRMRFNKPFKFIKLKFGALSIYIPRFRRSTKYLSWLDYDRSLDTEILQDIDGIFFHVGKQSIIIFTVDARPKLPKELLDDEKISLEEKELLTLQQYQEWFAPYVAEPITRDITSRLQVAPLFYEVITERIKKTLGARDPELRFIQIFNYVYKDGAPMFTIGGMVGTEDDEQQIRKISNPFIRTGDDPLEISVPPLTLREKHWLDSHLDQNLNAKKLRFELDEQLLENYQRFYKQYPTYMETLL